MSSDRLESEAAPAYLVRIAGPRMEMLVLDPHKAPLTLGRHEHCELQTDVDEERVSRFHARFVHQGGRWHVTDLKSTWGTYLNGFRLPPERLYMLAEGDLLRITPWTFSFRSTPARAGSVAAADDLGVTSIRSIAPRQESTTGDPVSLIVEAAAGIHQAGDEAVLAQLVVEMAQRGSGYARAAYLRPADAEGRIEVVAAAPAGDNGPYSRSMIDAAATGEMAVLDPSLGSTSQSIVQLQISAALCVPLMLGQAVAGYLYLDSRADAGHAPRRVHPRAQDFCLALARIASLSLANMKRVEIERRQAFVNAQLEQAGTIQKLLLPQGEVCVGPLTVVGVSRPGQMVCGDFYDVIPLHDGRVAITLGDVSGKGVTASVLMTTIHGFLHALLESGMELHEAVVRVNAFLEARKPVEQFATMFAAVIDPGRGEITYMDAAHGYGMLWRGGEATWLHEGGGPPLGISTASSYVCARAPFERGDALVIVSDGIIEQPALTRPGREQFEMTGVADAVRDVMRDTHAAGSGPSGAVVESIMQAVEQHAGSQMLADDATIVVASWS